MGSGDWDEGLLGNGIPVFCQTRLSPDFPPVSIPFMVVLFWLLDLKALLTGSSAEHSSHGSGEEEQSFAQIQTAVWLLSQAFTAFLETLLSLLALLCPTYVYGVIYTIASSLRGFGFWGSIVFAPLGLEQQGILFLLLIYLTPLLVPFMEIFLSLFFPLFMVSLKQLCPLKSVTYGSNEHWLMEQRHHGGCSQGWEETHLGGKGGRRHLPCVSEQKGICWANSTGRQNKTSRNLERFPRVRNSLLRRGGETKGCSQTLGIGHLKGQQIHPQPQVQKVSWRGRKLVLEGICNLSLQASNDELPQNCLLGVALSFPKAPAGGFQS